MKNQLVVLLVFISGMMLQAQTTDQIIAVGNANAITLDHVQKINDPAKAKDTTLPFPSFNYNLQPKRFNTSVELDTSGGGGS